METVKLCHLFSEDGVEGDVLAILERRAREYEVPALNRSLQTTFDQMSECSELYVLSVLICSNQAESTHWTLSSSASLA